jgi:hypothetical protein
MLSAHREIPASSCLVFLWLVSRAILPSIALAEEHDWRCTDSRARITLWNADAIAGTQMRFAPDGSLWVIELRGNLKRLVETDIGIEAKTVLDLGKLARSSDPQMGATSFVFAPEFDGRNGRVFIAHNWDESDGERKGAISSATLHDGQSNTVHTVFGPIASSGAHQLDRLIMPDAQTVLATCGSRPCHKRLKLRMERFSS